MTDLSTKHIQRLLAASTPGPWTVRVNKWDETIVGNRAGYEMAAGEQVRFLFEAGHPGVDTQLAALAPKLAAEVLRIRRRLNKMVADLEAMDGDAQYSDIEQLFAAFTASNLRSVIGHQNLGDQDG